jgi:hypothetical protein
MVIDMNEAQVRTVEQVRQVLEGTQALQFRAAQDDEGRYGWVDAVLRRLDYRQLRRADRGPVLAYLQRLSGYSRAQVTRLVARWTSGKPLVKNYRAPEHAFARRYTGADVALLAEVDRAMGTLSGPATVCVLRRQRDVFGDTRFDRLGSISVGHLYNLRNSGGYRQQRVPVGISPPLGLMPKAQGSATAAMAMNTAARPIMECMKATSSGILVICTRRAITVPALPPASRPMSTQTRPDGPALPKPSASLRISAAVVTTAMPMPVMPKTLPRMDVVGWDRPLRAWMKQTLATRYSSVTRFMLITVAPLRTEFPAVFPKWS